MTTDPLRLDKWLWAARFFKTRSLAKTAIENGKIYYQGNKAKPSRLVEVGAEILVKTGVEERTIRIVELSGQRRSAPLAQQLYCETEASIQQRQQQAELRQAQPSNAATFALKPNKKQRRAIKRFKETNHE